MDFNKQTNTPEQRKSRENENETVHKGKKNGNTKRQIQVQWAQISTVHNL